MPITTPIVRINSNPNKAKSVGSSRVVQNNTGNPSFCGDFKTYTVGKGAKSVIEWIGKRSSPFNRFLLGATALLLQPYIDLHNKDVDEKTREASWARTIGKNVAGMTSGILVRLGCIKSIESLTRTPEEIVSKKLKETDWNKALIPTGMSRETYAKAERLVKKHRETIGSFVALGVMMITNLVFDVPVTKAITNSLLDKIAREKQEKTNLKGGINE